VSLKTCYLATMNISWWHGVVVSSLALISVVNRHWARLVLVWVTVNHPPRSTQPSISSQYVNSVPACLADR